MVPVNYLAVFVAAVASIVLGFLWYGPLFGKPWMKIMGFTTADMEKAKKQGMGKTYFLMTAGSLVMAFVLSHVVVFSAAYLKSTPLMTGIMTGFWMWLGFLATTQIDEQLWGNKPWKLYAINTGYRLVSLVAMGVILSLWPAM